MKIPLDCVVTTRFMILPAQKNSKPGVQEKEKIMENKLDSYHLPVTGRNILRFAFPTIVMTVFNTFYTMVDGLFVSNLIGMEALSAINLTAPAIALITAVSGMLATGGSAVVMKKMGEHK